MRRLAQLSFFILFLFSCGRVNEKAKKTINEGGETVGKTATEFFEGVSKGVNKTLECELVLSHDLKEGGLQTGKFFITNDSLRGKDNVLVLYVIFNKDFKKAITAKAFDKSGLECGRTRMNVEGKTGEAKYYDFVFDKRTQIESKGKITLE